MLEFDNLGEGDEVVRDAAPLSTHRSLMGAGFSHESQQQGGGAQETVSMPMRVCADASHAVGRYIQKTNMQVLREIQARLVGVVVSQLLPPPPFSSLLACGGRLGIEYRAAGPVFYPRGQCLQVQSIQWVGSPAQRVA